MTLDTMIEVLRRDLTISSNPRSHHRNAIALGLLLSAQEAWKMPGRQALAMTLESDAIKLMQATGNEETWHPNWMNPPAE